MDDNEIAMKVGAQIARYVRDGDEIDEAIIKATLDYRHEIRSGDGRVAELLKSLTKLHLN